MFLLVKHVYVQYFMLFLDRKYNSESKDNIRFYLL